MYLEEFDVGSERFVQSFENEVGSIKIFQWTEKFQEKLLYDHAKKKKRCLKLRAFIGSERTILQKGNISCIILPLLSVMPKCVQILFEICEVLL